MVAGLVSVAAGPPQPHRTGLEEHGTGFTPSVTHPIAPDKQNTSTRPGKTGQNHRVDAQGQTLLGLSSEKPRLEGLLRVQFRHGQNHQQVCVPNGISHQVYLDCPLRGVIDTWTQRQKMGQICLKKHPFAVSWGCFLTPSQRQQSGNPPWRGREESWMRCRTSNATRRTSFHSPTVGNEGPQSQLNDLCSYTKQRDSILFCI